MSLTWHTEDDDHVRPEHAEKDGQVFRWGEGEAPGEAPNCRCVAGPTEMGSGRVESVYPELYVLGAGALRSLARLLTELLNTRG